MSNKPTSELTRDPIVWNEIRICYVIPGEEAGSSMIFAKRDVEQIRRVGVSTKTFFLKTRTRPVLLAREWIRLRRELKLFQPHIVHAHYGTMTGFVTVLTAAAPTVVTFRGAELNHELDISLLREKAGRVLSLIAAVRASQIVCVSDELKRRLWWCQNKVSVIPSSVDLGLFRLQERGDARKTLGWEEDQSIVIFYKGRNPMTKRIDRALATIDKAREMYGPIRLEVLDGSIDPVRVPLFLNAADCLLCTSDSEGSPNIVKEAMACNLPVVSVDVGDVRQRMANVENCYIRARDPYDLANGLITVLRSHQRSNGRLHLAGVTNNVCRDQLLDLYRLVLSANSLS